MFHPLRRTSATALTPAILALGLIAVSGLFEEPDPTLVEIEPRPD